MGREEGGVCSTSNEKISVDYYDFLFDLSHLLNL